MSNLAVNVITILALPLVVFQSGVWIMSEMSGRQYVVQRLLQVAALEDRTPLNQRLGYDVKAVDHHWGALDDTARGAEERFLELDLVFPFLYGAALAASLLMAWTTLSKPFSPVWLITPVAITLLADWTENLVQLGQLRRYADGGKAALQASWIQIASIATVLKLSFFIGSSLFLIGLVAIVVVRSLRAA
jgi:hypothetical protein